MEKKPEKRALGRGLSALMADVSFGEDDQTVASASRAPSGTFVPVHAIRPNPDQPRRTFDEAALLELANSIRTNGIIQPIVVREVDGDPALEIVAGERRWRAAQLAQLHEVPVVIRQFSDQEMIEIAIIENIQRADLTSIEEALAFRQLMDKFGHTQEQMAQALSKSRSHVANTLRLLTLPESVQSLVNGGKLSAGHARALIGSSDPHALALKVIGGGLSVRKTEELARKVSVRRAEIGNGSRRGEKDADTRAIEADLSANLGMGVTIDHGPAGDGGRLSVRYATLEQLDMLCQVLSVIPRDFKA